MLVRHKRLRNFAFLYGDSRKSSQNQTSVLLTIKRIYRVLRTHVFCSSMVSEPEGIVVCLILRLFSCLLLVNKVASAESLDVINAEALTSRLNEMEHGQSAEILNRLYARKAQLIEKWIQRCEMLRLTIESRISETNSLVDKGQLGPAQIQTSTLRDLLAEQAQLGRATLNLVEKMEQLNRTGAKGFNSGVVASVLRRMRFKIEGSINYRVELNASLSAREDVKLERPRFVKYGKHAESMSLNNQTVDILKRANLLETAVWKGNVANELVIRAPRASVINVGGSNVPMLPANERAKIVDEAIR